MSLPRPNVSFKIPSIHDDVELDCRIYYPRSTEQNSKAFGRTFAIVAHPYAPLGGCYDDPVVAVIGTVLLQHGSVLTTFNFRGASGSAGRTSWSGKPELSDYVSVYGFMLHYINAIAQTHPGPDQRPIQPPTLVLGGYSYGSMIASHLPSREFVVDLFDSVASDSAETEVKHRAVDLSRDARAFFEMHSAPVALSTTISTNARGEEQPKKPKPGVIMGGYESSRISRENSRRSVDAERIRQGLGKVRRKIGPNNSQPSSPSNVLSAPATEPTTPPAECTSMVLPDIAYLVVSPILSTAAGFTTMFSQLRFTSKGRQGAPTTEEFHELTTHPCCCLYGNKDGFTSARKLQRWSEELKLRPGSQLTAIEADAGHFWHEADGIVRLNQGVAEFLEGLTRLYTACEETQT